MGYILLFIALFPVMFAILLIASGFFYVGRLSGSEWAVQYGYHLAYAIDQLANTVLGGAADETISQRTAKALASGEAKWWVKYFGRFVDILAILVANDRNHIATSITDDVGLRELWSWKKEKE